MKVELGVRKDGTGKGSGTLEVGAGDLKTRGLGGAIPDFVIDNPQERYSDRFPRPHHRFYRPLWRFH